MEQWMYAAVSIAGSLVGIALSEYSSRRHAKIDHERMLEQQEFQREAYAYMNGHKFYRESKELLRCVNAPGGKGEAQIGRDEDTGTIAPDRARVHQGDITEDV